MPSPSCSQSGLSPVESSGWPYCEPVAILLGPGISVVLLGPWPPLLSLSADPRVDRQGLRLCFKTFFSSLTHAF